MAEVATKRIENVTKEMEDVKKQMEDVKKVIEHVMKLLRMTHKHMNECTKVRIPRSYFHRKQQYYKKLSTNSHIEYNNY